MSSSSDENVTADEIVETTVNPEINVSRSKLNPSAAAWIPVTENDRSLYISFFMGEAPTRTQIALFFTRRYGDGSVERVYIKHPRGAFPLWGKIVFKETAMVRQVLRGTERARFSIAGKVVIFKKFRTRTITQEDHE